MTKTFKAQVRLESNALQEVRIDATNWNNARQLLEMQYGKGNVMNVTQIAGAKDD